MGKKIICIEDLTVGYTDGTDGVKKISLDVYEGESVAVLGANGAGKSTLLLSILGILEASCGKIQIEELLLEKSNLREIRKKVGLIFQNPDDQLFMSHVYEDVAFGPRNFGFAEDEVDRRVKDVLKRLEILPLMKRAPLKLSGGEKRRVAIAGVLAMEPDVILFDEPSSFLDPRGKRMLTALLKNLNTTKVIATHDFHLAMEVCERTILLWNGKREADGPTKEILNDTELLKRCGL